MSLSERQRTLIGAAADALVEHLVFTRPEAIEVIGRALSVELQMSEVTFENLEYSSTASRTAFVRKVVRRLTEALVARGEFRKEHIDRALAAFMEVLHRTWIEGR